MDGKTLETYVAAVRNDPLVGRGTCSSVDECWSDDELAHEIERAAPTSAYGAVELARDIEELFLERGLDARWGEDDDPQLVEYRTWKARRAMMSMSADA